MTYASFRPGRMLLAGSIAGSSLGACPACHVLLVTRNSERLASSSGLHKLSALNALQ